MPFIPNGRDYGAYQSCTSKSNGAYQIDGYFSHFMSVTTTIVYDIEDATTVVVDVDQATNISYDPETSVEVDPE